MQGETILDVQDGNKYLTKKDHSKYKKIRAAGFYYRKGARAEIMK